MPDRVRTARKAKVWDAVPGFTQLLTAAGTTAIAGLSFSDPSTVIRMLGEYTISPTSAPTALDDVRIAIGIGKVSTDAFTLGATALPDPAGEAEYPWLYWAEHSFTYPSNSTSLAGAASMRKAFDIRSMRKFTVRETLAVVIQYVDITGTPLMTLSFGQVRCLLARH